jgi:hypothetical protein
MLLAHGLSREKFDPLASDFSPSFGRHFTPLTTLLTEAG